MSPAPPAAMRPKSMGAVQQSAKNAHVHSYEITRAHLTVALQRRRHANFGVRRAFSTHAASHTARQRTARPSRLRATPLRRPTPTRCTFALVTSQIHLINSKKLLHYRQRKAASLLRLTNDFGSRRMFSILHNRPVRAASKLPLLL